MSSLDELQALLGAPAHRLLDADSWSDIEQHLGSALPSDFKAFLDVYGSGVISGELVVFHPRGSSPLLTRMTKIHQTFSERRGKALDRDDSQHFPYAFHPEPGGLISWGYDHSGDEHFFLPCDPDPDRWKIVTMIHEEGCETFDGPFSSFALAFVKRLLDVDQYHGIDPEALEFLEPEDLEELAAAGEIGPVQPSFGPF
ncbi:SMI1/KNR4 family protein [Kitasatospora sp. NBC_01287]|uniref:SMI1/KNR4 family protein n=1 Tax=Kitasatospora sp. NBC_01287 TaxID=2903573 RepID=UPI00224E09E3|nr:SMI1/KNR4 family protein [Kitasatospora sp. NBC_01287]MCX4745194.1 SMI1/KNR4 family protein [Kitasatospora sp. NBC_01287]